MHFRYVTTSSTVTVLLITSPIAHDIAADYADNGVDITLVQRSSTYIMTNKEGMPRLMRGQLTHILPNLTLTVTPGTYWEGGPPTEVADIIDNSMPIFYRKMLHKRITADIAEADK